MSQQKKPVGKPGELTHSDLAQDIMGKNALQGADQLSVRNQRRSVPGEKQETDGVIESFEKLDKDVRAEEDLGKGNRSGKNPKQAGPK
ncbi:MAG: hypothetical protein AB7F96_18205 [Beijerinckiaceae bacterium]